MNTVVFRVLISNDEVHFASQTAFIWTKHNRVRRFVVELALKLQQVCLVECKSVLTIIEVDI